MKGQWRLHQMWAKAHYTFLFALTFRGRLNLSLCKGMTKLRWMKLATIEQVDKILSKLQLKSVNMSNNWNGFHCEVSIEWSIGLAHAFYLLFDFFLLFFFFFLGYEHESQHWIPFSFFLHAHFIEIDFFSLFLFIFTFLNALDWHVLTSIEMLQSTFV